MRLDDKFTKLELYKDVSDKFFRYVNSHPRTYLINFFDTESLLYLKEKNEILRKALVGKATQSELQLICEKFDGVIPQNISSNNRYW